VETTSGKGLGRETANTKAMTGPDTLDQGQDQEAESKDQGMTEVSKKTTVIDQGLMTDLPTEEAGSSTIEEVEDHLTDQEAGLHTKETSEEMIELQDHLEMMFLSKV